ncbi:MAG TPA: MFS transporter [Fimbriimonadaceae bacterium]|jgi:DHA1 family multidrug resistance protein-like MFS transporter
MNTIDKEDMSDSPASTPLQPLWKKPLVRHLLLIALCGEIGYAVLNISTMPVFLRERHYLPNGFDLGGRGLGEATVGLVLMAFLLSEALFKGPMGHIADKYGRKRLMTIGPIFTVFTSLASFVVPWKPAWLEILIFVLLRVMDGIGAAMLWPGAFASMGDAVEDNQRQQAMSLLNVCYLLGVALALPIGGIVDDLSGHPYASLFLASGLFCVVAFTAHKFLPDDRKVKQHAPVEGEAGSIMEIFHSARDIPQYLILAIITFAGIGFPMAVIKNFAIDEFHLSESAFGLLVLPAALCMAAFSVPMSKFGEKLGRARAVHLGMGLCSGGLIFISLGAFSHLFRNSLVFAVGGIPVGVGFLLAIPAWMASVSDTDASKRAANLGAVMAAQGVGAIIGAPIGAFLYENLQSINPHFGRYSPFIGCAACVTLGWVVGLQILKDKPRPFSSQV